MHSTNLNKLKLALAIHIALTAALLSGCAGNKQSTGALDQPHKNIHGSTVRPALANQQTKLAVLVFITTDCPIANSYCPEINRIAKDYAKKNIKLTLVHVDPDVTAKQAKKHADEYKLMPAIVIDHQRTLIKITGATVTPEAAVFDSSGKLIYRGRINNQYAGFGDRRAAATVHDLRAAIDAGLAGKPVANPRTKALGCFIPGV
jgi:thiol-disulfide isomerase/thioredoxin